MNACALAVFGSTLALWIAACRKGAAPPPPPPTVQVSGVIQQDVPIYREWVGTLDGFVNADIRPQVTGYIQKQALKEGSFVQEGDLLFEIDPRNYTDASAQAKSTLDRNLATLAKAQLDVRRDKELIAGQAITRTQQDTDLASERDAAASLALARAALSQAQLSHGWSRVTAPISGIAGIVQGQGRDLV